MTTIRNLIEAIEKIAPSSLAIPDDPIGMQIGVETSHLKKAIVALDPSVGLFEFAAKQNAQAVVLHHPLFYHTNPILHGEQSKTKIVRIAMENDIAVIGVHTNWDSAIGGVNDTLAELLGLKNSRPCGDEIELSQSKIVTFIPSEIVTKLIDTMSNSGCGVIGNYERCAFVSEGEGTFKGGENSNPSFGEKGKIENVKESRVEMIVQNSKLSTAIDAIKSVHPYEEPAYDVFAISETKKTSLSRMADLSSPVNAKEFAKTVELTLDAKVRLFGNPDQILNTIGIIGGAAGEMWRGVQNAGCDALITGEVRQHDALDANNEGFIFVEAGHFHTENPGMKTLAKRLEQEMPTVEFIHWEPEPGHFGRPI